MNRYIEERGIRAPKVNEDIVLTCCILWCLSIIPYLNIFTGIAGFVIWIIILREFKQSTVAILKARLRACRTYGAGQGGV